MKREFFTAGPRPERRFHEQRGGSCIALIDSRFLLWLSQNGQTGGNAEGISRQGLIGLLSQALFHAGLDVELRRIYWYSDRNDGQVVDDQIVRTVQSNDADGGASLLRAMGQDLRQLADHRASDHVLVASDDERLLATIDQAQLCGLGVHVLADEAARNVPGMLRNDPGWARLLMQADRRVVINSQVLADALQGRAPVGAQMGVAMVMGAEELEELRKSMNEVVSAWWEEEPEDLREDLREALQVSRGVPQEVDRQLLHRMRHKLNRALSLHEKKLLRETLRHVVMGPDESGVAAAYPADSEA